MEVSTWERSFLGQGLSYGRALMIKAGYNGSGINDVVYMGDVVNAAAKLAARGSVRTWTPAIMADRDFAQNLNEENTATFRWDGVLGCFASDAESAAMAEWYRLNCT